MSLNKSNISICAAFFLIIISLIIGCTGDAEKKDTYDAEIEDTNDAEKKDTYYPYGINALLDLSTIPLLRAGVMTRQISSFDREGGNENDGFLGTYSTLYKENDKYVIFDSYGPGCVYMIWFTYFIIDKLPGDIEFYLDGGESPLIDLSLKEMFSGSTPPFLAPLVGNSLVSSGGFSSYVPIPFKDRLKIAVDSLPFFLHVTYHKYRKDVEITSFTGKEDMSSLIDILNTAGSYQGEEDLQILEGNLSVSPSSTGEIAHVSSGGTIRGIRISPSPKDPDAIRNTWLKMRWDNAESPQVNAPLGEFFGSGHGEVDVKALYLGMSPGGDYYCYLPMPFSEEAVIEIENKGQADVSLEYDILLDEHTPLDNALPFHATWMNEYPTTQDKDYTILNVEGRGHFVGVNMTMRGPLNRNYLEGDIRVHLDGNRSPALHGTGTEDYFNGGWYFIHRTFTLPMHGNPLHVVEQDKDITGCYRFHISDTINFESSIRFTIEHGPQNDVTADYSSVAYYYVSDDVKMALVDEMDVGDPESESGHQYHIEGESDPSGLIESFYDGEDDETPYSDDGYIIHGTTHFTLIIPSQNTGIRLRRKTDQAIGRQTGEVFVDGESVGVWYTPQYNPHKRWLEAEYDIPSQYTRGKDKIDVSINSLNPEVPWNEYYYWVYAFTP